MILLTKEQAEMEINSFLKSDAPNWLHRYMMALSNIFCDEFPEPPKMWELFYQCHTESREDLIVSCYKHVILYDLSFISDVKCGLQVDFKTFAKLQAALLALIEDVRENHKMVQENVSLPEGYPYT